MFEQFAHSAWMARYVRERRLCRGLGCLAVSRLYLPNRLRKCSKSSKYVVCTWKLAWGVRQ